MSIFRMTVRLQNRLISAVPTCTLWQIDLHRQVVFFRLWPALNFTHAEMQDREI